MTTAELGKALLDAKVMVINKLRAKFPTLEAEDLYQDACLRAFTHLDQFEGRSKFSTWLMRIAINGALMKLRGRLEASRAAGKFVALEDITSMRDPLDLEAFAIRQQQLDHAFVALDALPPGYRAAVTLQFFGEMTHAEAAWSMGKSIGTSKSQFHKGRIRLQLLHKRLYRRRLRPRA